MSSSEREAVMNILQAIDSPRFMDLGSYTGDDAAGMFAASHGHVKGLAVEADPQNYESLKLKRLPIYLEFGAISDHNGMCDFWKCNTDSGRGSGSIREPTGHRVKDGIHYDFVKTQVPCFTLDSLFAKYEYDRIDVLWTDLQGGERDMIAGGANALAHTSYLLIESEYSAELYKDQAMRPELLALLPGWHILESFDWNLLMWNMRLEG